MTGIVSCCLTASRDDRLERKKVSLRKAKADDMDSNVFFEARNEPEARKYSRNPHAISKAEHVAWFEAAIHDSSRAMFVIEYDGTQVGYCRVEGQDNEVSIAILPDYRGMHIGSETLRLLGEWFRGKQLLGVIREDNMASKRIFETAGFRRKGVRGVWESWGKLA